MSELRWHPLLGEWVITATHRQDRTFLPPPDFCPLCPTKANGHKTEIPADAFEFVVFENRFPSLQQHPPIPAVEGRPLSPVRPSCGVCEVVVYTPEHSSTLAAQSVEHIANLIRVWTDRYEILGRLSEIEYVFIFENKGTVIGVTLEHPHGQIYGYPFIPPHIQRQLDVARAHLERSGRCISCDVLADEINDRRRVVTETPRFVAYIPFFARWPYEVHISPRRHVQALPDLDAEDRKDLATTLKTVLMAYDALWNQSMPYVMTLFQRPTNGATYDHCHFRIELCPPLRTKTKLKYLAGSELGAGTFINDSLPEEKAAELRACATSVAAQHISAVR